jgi:hypothetical protein
MLIHFSTFEPINLTPDSIMQKAGVPMLYELDSNCACSALHLPCSKRAPEGGGGAQ